MGMASQAAAGRAVTSGREAVRRYRALAEQDSTSYLPLLAGELNNLSNRLSDAGYRGEALTTMEEATTHYRALAEQDPVTYLPDLALALNNLGLRLETAGGERFAEALVTGEEAARIYRRLVKRDPEVHLPGLARALDNLGVRLSTAGRHPEGLAVSQEAVRHYRVLAGRDLEFLPQLAGALNNLSLSLGTAGRHLEALDAAEGAAGLYHVLAERDPHRYLPDIAMISGNLDVHLRAAGRWAEALAAGEESARSYRSLAEQNPRAFLPDLVLALNNLARGHLEAADDPSLAPVLEWLATPTWTASAEYHTGHLWRLVPGQLDAYVDRIPDSDLLLVHAGLLDLAGRSGVERAYALRRDPVSAYREARLAIDAGDQVHALAHARLVIGTAPHAEAGWQLLSEVEAGRHEDARAALYARRGVLAASVEVGS
jgi:tetratricopeptide (TPR) repeat protein